MLISSLNCLNKVKCAFVIARGSPAAQHEIRTSLAYLLLTLYGFMCLSPPEQRKTSERSNLCSNLRFYTLPRPRRGRTCATKVRPLRGRNNLTHDHRATKVGPLRGHAEFYSNKSTIRPPILLRIHIRQLRQPGYGFILIGDTLCRFCQYGGGTPGHVLKHPAIHALHAQQVIAAI